MRNKQQVTMVINRLAKGQEIPRSLDHAEKKIDRNFHSLLSQALSLNGWKHYDHHSRCSVASLETHMEKGGRQISIITSSFFGTFTQLDVYSAN